MFLIVRHQASHPCKATGKIKVCISESLYFLVENWMTKYSTMNDKEQAFPKHSLLLIFHGWNFDLSGLSVDI
jgi:hypothetical protein